MIVLLIILEYEYEEYNKSFLTLRKQLFYLFIIEIIIISWMNGWNLIKNLWVINYYYNSKLWIRILIYENFNK